MSNPCMRRVTLLRLWSAVRTLIGPGPLEEGIEALARRWEDELGEEIFDVDVVGLAGWLVAGVSLFSGEKSPNMRQAMRAADRVVLGLTLERCGGNVTRMSESLGCARRVVREHLKTAGLYEEVLARRRGSRGRGSGDEGQEGPAVVAVGELDRGDDDSSQVLRLPTTSSAGR